ncbi:MAG: hypothetical protein ACR2MW_04835 [Chthoniobacterales bacterium]
MEIRSKAHLKKLFVLGVALSLMSCASHARRTSRSTVPSDRRYESALLKPSSRRNCPITVVREKGVSVSGLNLYLDGNQIARVAAGESLTVYVTPRRHQLSIRPLFSPPSTLRLVPRPGDPITVRIVDRNGKDELMIAHRGWLASLGGGAKRPFSRQSDGR